LWEASKIHVSYLHISNVNWGFVTYVYGLT
jgi:hypothetical protein